MQTVSDDFISYGINENRLRVKKLALNRSAKSYGIPKTRISSVLKIWLIFVFSITAELASAQAWRVEGNQLLRDGNPAFLRESSLCPSANSPERAFR